MLKVDDEGAIIVSQAFAVDKARIVLGDSDVIHGLDSRTSALVEHSIDRTCKREYAVIDISVRQPDRRA
ncbi:MAG: hypothetical protein U0P30_11605 [Vicinamibacterales bacterium]